MNLVFPVLMSVNKFPFLRMSQGQNFSFTYPGNFALSHHVFIVGGFRLGK